MQDEALSEAVRARKGLDPTTAPNPMYEGFADFALRHEDRLHSIATACRTLIDMHTDIAEQKRTQLKELLAQSSDLFQKRNQYVHGTALPGIDGEITSIRRRSLKAEPEVGPIDLAALDKLSNDIKRLSAAVAAWSFEVYPDARWR